LNAVTTSAGVVAAMVPRFEPWLDTGSVVRTATTPAMPPEIRTRLIMVCSFARVRAP
jgi:hypothetical protein